MPSNWRWRGRSMTAGQTDIATICATLGISRATLYRYLKEHPVATRRIVLAEGPPSAPPVLRPGAHHARPRQTPPPRPADRRLAGGPRSPRQLLPAPGGQARPELRPRLDTRAAMPSGAGRASTRSSFSSCNSSCSSRASAPSGKLIETASLNLAHRWYLGYALDEDLPDHSSLTRIRQRLGIEIFQRFFERSSTSVRKPGWSGVGSCTSMPPRSRPTPTLDSLVPRFCVRGADARGRPVCGRAGLAEADTRAGRRRPAGRHRAAADRALRRARACRG